jgi:3-oxoacyl-[acyl-carrier-protein] synthase-3
MRVGIIGLGEWVPESIRTNDAWPAEFIASHAARAGAEFTTVAVSENGDELDRLVAEKVASEANDPFLGTKERRVAAESMTAHEAEALAAEAALRDAGIEADAIDVVMSATAVPDRLTPPAAAWVAHAIGASKARALGVDAVCASAVAGLEIAAALVESGRARYVLMTQSHLMTRAFPVMHPASPNVGDAATALVVSRVEHGGLRGTHVVSNGEYFHAVVWRRKEGDSRWWLGGGPMAMGSYDSDRAREVVKDTVRIGVNTIAEVLSIAGARARDLDVMVSVQPRKWVPAIIAQGVGLDPNRAVETFEGRAHLGACGIVTNLLAARRSGRLGRGARVAMYAQGAGLTRAAAILEWSRDLD